MNRLIHFALLAGAALACGSPAAAGWGHLWGARHHGYYYPQVGGYYYGNRPVVRDDSGGGEDDELVRTVFYSGDRSVSFPSDRSIDRFIRLRFSDLDFGDDSNDSRDESNSSEDDELVRSSGENQDRSIGGLGAVSEMLNLLRELRGDGGGGLGGEDDLRELRRDVERVQNDLVEVQRLQSEQIDRLESAVAGMQQQRQAEKDAAWQAAMEQKMDAKFADIDRKFAELMNAINEKD